jgi:hypothetical protein
MYSRPLGPSCCLTLLLLLCLRLALSCMAMPLWCCQLNVGCGCCLVSDGALIRVGI